MAFLFFIIIAMFTFSLINILVTIISVAVLGRSDFSHFPGNPLQGNGCFEYLAKNEISLASHYN